MRQACLISGKQRLCRDRQFHLGNCLVASSVDLYVHVYTCIYLYAHIKTHIHASFMNNNNAIFSFANIYMDKSLLNMSCLFT